MPTVPPQDSSSTHLERARKGARRTAWVVTGIAFAVYLGFLLMEAMPK